MGHGKRIEPGSRAWDKRKTAKQERRKEKVFGQQYDPDIDPAPPAVKRKHHTWDRS